MMNGIWLRDNDKENCGKSSEFKLCLDPKKGLPASVYGRHPDAVDFFTGSKKEGVNLPLVLVPVTFVPSVNLLGLQDLLWKDKVVQGTPSGTVEFPYGSSVAEGEELCAQLAPVLTAVVTKLWDHQLVASWETLNLTMCTCQQAVAIGWKCNDIVSIVGRFSLYCPQTCLSQSELVSISSSLFTSKDRGSCNVVADISQCLNIPVGCAWYYHGTPGSGSCLPLAYCPTWLSNCSSEACLTSRAMHNLTVPQYPGEGPCLTRATVDDISEHAVPVGLADASGELHSPHHAIWDTKTMENYCTVHLCYKTTGAYNCTCKQIVDIFKHRMANPCKMSAPTPCVGTLFDQCPGVCIAQYAGQGVDFHLGLTPVGQLKVNLGKLLAAVMLPVFSYLTVLLQKIFHPFYFMRRIAKHAFVSS